LIKILLVEDPRKSCSVMSHNGVY